MLTLFQTQIEEAEAEIARIENTGKRLKLGQLTWPDQRKINRLREDIAKAQKWLENSESK